MSMILSGLYGVLSIIIVVLVGAVYGALYLYSVDLTQNIYIAALLCICLLLLIVFCADMTSVTAVMLWMVTCGCGVMSH